MNPFLKRIGGKFYLKNKILPLFPKMIQDYCEPFLGGGSVFLNLQSQGINVNGISFLNDLDSNTFTLWKCFEQPELFKKLMLKFEKLALYDESIFQYLKNKEYSDIVDQGFKILILTMLSFQGDMKSYYIGIGDINRKNAKIYNPDSYWIKYLNYLKEYNVKISKKDYHIFFNKPYNRESFFMYADPPYDKTRGYDNLPFTQENQIELSELFKNYKGKGIISNSDTKLIRELYSSNRFLVFMIKARHCSNSKSIKNSSNGVNELLILNYNPEIDYEKIDYLKLI